MFIETAPGLAGNNVNRATRWVTRNIDTIPWPNEMAAFIYKLDNDDQHPQTLGHHGSGMRLYIGKAMFHQSIDADLSIMN